MVFYLKVADLSVYLNVSWCYKYDIKKLFQYTTPYFNILFPYIMLFLVQSRCKRGHPKKMFKTTN